MSDTATARPDLFAELLAAEDRAAFERERGPCAECAKTEQCARREEACRAFSIFVDTGGSHRWRSAPRFPSREIFQQIFR